MNELVKKLSNGQHLIEFESRSESLQEIKERLDRGFVFVTFTQTRGGTEIGINIEKDLTDLSKAEFEKGSGIMQISGTCILNYQKVRCIANIDLSTRKGEGHLIPLNAADFPI